MSISTRVAARQTPAGREKVRAPPLPPPPMRPSSPPLPLDPSTGSPVCAPCKKSPTRDEFRCSSLALPSPTGSVREYTDGAAGGGGVTQRLKVAARTGRPSPGLRLLVVRCRARGAARGERGSR